MDEREIFDSIVAQVLSGIYLNEQFVFGRINPKADSVKSLRFETCCFDLYRDCLAFALDKVPVDKSYLRDPDPDDFVHYKFGFYEYFKRLYPVYREIVKTEVTYDDFDLISELRDKEKRHAYYESAAKFVLAVRLRGLRRGARIDRYVSKLRYISPLIKRLITEKKGHFYLAESDPDSTVYKLALMSCFRYYNEENAKLFELKAQAWEKPNSEYV